MHRFKIAIVLLGCGLQIGCTIGPRALRITRAQYNAAIQQTNEDQILLNLVRLRYRDAPFFLETGSITAQFKFNLNASATRENGVGATRDLHIYGGSAGFEDRPTMTFTPLRGEDYVKRLMEPISTETIGLLYYSGWSIDRILRLLVHQMNGLENALSAAGPTPSEAPEFREFAKASSLLRHLQQQTDLLLAYESTTSPASVPISRAQLTAHDFVEARAAGLHFQKPKDGEDEFQLVAKGFTPYLRIRTKALRSGPASGLEGLLGWAVPEEEGDEIRIELVGGIHVGEREEAGRRKLTVATRSVMGVLFYISQAVTPPESHVEKGLVTLTTENGQPFEWLQVTKDLFEVHVSRFRPRDSAVTVRYRGHWFFVRDDDADSKSTLMLIAQLLALQSGNQKGQAPVLTIPVGG